MSVIDDPAAAVTGLASATGLTTTAAGDLALGPLCVRPIAVGWATVDLDRAAREARSSGPFEPTAPEELLGATARLGPVPERSGPEDGARVVLLEPSREGRLAGSLARRGEGWAALYVTAVGPGSASLDTACMALAEAGFGTRRAGGPLGDSALVLGPGSSGQGAPPGSVPALIVVAGRDGTGGAAGVRGSSGDGVPSRP